MFGSVSLELGWQCQKAGGASMASLILSLSSYPCGWHGTGSFFPHRGISMLSCRVGWMLLQVGQGTKRLCSEDWEVKFTASTCCSFSQPERECLKGEKTCATRGLSVMTRMPRELHELPKVVEQVQRKASRLGLCSVDEMRWLPEAFRWQVSRKFLPLCVRPRDFS